MKRAFTAAVLVAGVLQIAAPASAAEPITPDTTIFTVIEYVDGDILTLRMLHSVMSRNAETILFVGDEIHVALEPPLPGKTRRGGCVTGHADRRAGRRG